MGAYRRAHLENAAQTAVGKVWKKMKADFPAADELEEEMKSQANVWETLSFTKKSKMTDFLSKTVQRKKIKSDKRVTPN